MHGSELKIVRMLSFMKCGKFAGYDGILAWSVALVVSTTSVNAKCLNKVRKKRNDSWEGALTLVHNRTRHIEIVL